eukprot:8284313-Pyramimonas_sp.AAC.1
MQLISRARFNIKMFSRIATMWVGSLSVLYVPVEWDRSSTTKIQTRCTKLPCTAHQLPTHHTYSRPLRWDGMSGYVVNVKKLYHRNDTVSLRCPRRCSDVAGGKYTYRGVGNGEMLVPIDCTPLATANNPAVCRKTTSPTTQFKACERATNGTRFWSGSL